LRLLLQWMELLESIEPLRDPDLFGKVRVNPETGTIEWPNGADLAPDALYDRITRKSLTSPAPGLS